MNSSKTWKGALIGAASGLVGSFAMNAVQAIWSHFDPPPPQEDSEDATVKTAQAIAEPIISRPLTKHEKEVAGPAVHYAFGTLVGAVYGALAASLPVVSAGYGTAYASAVWLFGDEVAVPALGLAPSPTEQPAKDQFKYWLAHAVYGLTLEGGRQIVEAAER